MELFTGDARWVGKAAGLTAAELMTTAVLTATPDEDIRTVAHRMLEGQVRQLPVLDYGTLVGIVSRRDVMRTVMLA